MPTKEFVKLLIVFTEWESTMPAEEEPSIFDKTNPKINIQSRTKNDEIEMIKYFCPDFDFALREMDIITLSVKFKEGELSFIWYKFECTSFSKLYLFCADLFSFK